MDLKSVIAIIGFVVGYLVGCFLTFLLMNGN